MQIDFFGNQIRCDTEDKMISLTDLARAGNQWRAARGLPIKPLSQVTESVGFIEFKAVAEREMPEVELLRVEGRGSSKRTMGHVNLAIYFAEQYSPEFHFYVINTFVQGKILEFRQYGGTEFKTMNSAIDMYLPEREGKDNKGVFIQAAKLLRDNILGPDAKTEDWNTASVAQTRTRYEFEHDIAKALERGLIKNYDHLKELIGRL